MKTNVRLALVALMVGAAMLITACGNNTTAGGGGGSTATTIDIGSNGENLAFDKTTLTVKAAAPVVVKFKNNSSAQQHNWVLVKGGDAVAAKIAADGLAAGAAGDFLPADKANIIASTKLLNGGELGEISFTAPAAGTYEFICTVPGHYPLMKGNLTVN